MTKITKKDNGLIITIAVAALGVSVSMIFLGIQIGQGGSLNDDVLGQKIEEGIDAYVQKAQEASQQDSKPKTVKEGDYSDDDPVLGDEDAPVTIVEFSDYQCPYCRSFFEEAYQDLKSEYIDTGKVKIVFRDYTLDFHKDAIPAAVAASCVREISESDKKYFEMHDKIFAGQSAKGDGTVEITPEELKGYALDLGVNGDKYDKCIADEDVAEEVAADLEEGRKLGISGTPAFILGTNVLEGAYPFEDFEAYIEAELKK